MVPWRSMSFFPEATDVFRRRFEPGEVVPESGIYQVDHDRHRLMHQATLERGTLFPQCRQCQSFVRFRLLHRVESQIVNAFGLTCLLEKFDRSQFPKKGNS